MDRKVSFLIILFLFILFLKQCVFSEIFGKLIFIKLADIKKFLTNIIVQGNKIANCISFANNKRENHVYVILIVLWNVISTFSIFQEGFFFFLWFLLYYTEINDTFLLYYTRGLFTDFSHNYADVVHATRKDVKPFKYNTTSSTIISVHLKKSWDMKLWIGTSTFKIW